MLAVRVVVCCEIVEGFHSGKRSGCEWNAASGLVFDAAGNLYGASNGGGNWGTLFSFNIGADTEHVIHYFKGGVHDGEFPIDSVVLDKISGNFVGTTQFGGAAHSGFSATGAGTVFELAP